MKFIHDDFLLQGKMARRLFHEVAEGQPIFDYHCHLPPGDVARNRRFANLAEIWLEGDHYKWRAMRTNGVPEELCTGAADPYEKYLAWARTVPKTLRNPLYHWTHLELARYFGINELLSEKTARAIWDAANERLRTEELSALGILRKFKVAVVCTTDDPADPLEFHQAIAKMPGVVTKVYPTFRPDMALRVSSGMAFNDWCERLAAVSGVDTGTFEGFLGALKQRHDFFHSLGGRLSDHGLETCYDDECDEAEAERIFDKVRGGVSAQPDEERRFASYLMVYFGQLDAEKGWTKQLHLGAMRNNNTRLMRKLGPDTGFDAIGDFPQARALSHYLDRLDQDGALPKTIIYNLNPADNYVVGTLIGTFQDGTLAGKVQLGSGWWFLDQLEGMTWQINALSNLGLLSRFVGMLTDSRSFLSYPRHEYFRRLLCNLIGADVEAGLMPDDWELVSGLVRGICYRNAKEYFGLVVGRGESEEW
jgi:glucuronate isomerase